MSSGSLLIVWHSRTGTSEQLAKASADGAGEGGAQLLILQGAYLGGAIHAARPDLRCLWHYHYTPAVAMARAKLGTRGPEIGRRASSKQMGADDT